MWWHAALPGWLFFVLGGYLAQLHFSLQHESIHAMRGLPRWLRWALVWPPVNLWLPYPLYNRSHSTHHVNFHLTHPQKDTESAYHSANHWQAYSGFWQRLYAANQTLLFRVIFGPLLRLYKLVRTESRRLLAKDFSHLPIWFWHVVSAAPILYFLSLCDISLTAYFCYFIYPGMMLGALRTFTEHRWSEAPHERVAIVESNWLMGFLYLFNNLHHVHHRAPTMPWYEIPVHFRRNRAAVLEANGNFYYRGYADVARRYLVRPVFKPVHPKW
jgi:fatty acid desaturase